MGLKVCNDDAKKVVLDGVDKLAKWMENMILKS